MVDLGLFKSTQCHVHSRNAAALCRFNRTRSEQCADHAGTSTAGTVAGQSVTKLSTKDQDIRVSDGDAGREIVPRSHHDRIF
jgi:hypothetical protein